MSQSKIDQVNQSLCQSVSSWHPKLNGKKQIVEKQRGGGGNAILNNKRKTHTNSKRKSYCQELQANQNEKKIKKRKKNQKRNIQNGSNWCNYLKKFLNIWPKVLFLAGSLFCVMTCSSSVNLIGVLITGFGDVFSEFLQLLAVLWFEMVCLSLAKWSFVKSVALDACRHGVNGRSLTLFNENALPPNSERA